MKIGPWIEALRLRTLPLSLSGAIVASGCAAADGVFRLEVCVLLLFTVLLLQVLSNFADEYGDLKKGADTEERIGPVRGMQRGEISFSQMRHALVGLFAATLVVGCILVYLALGSDLLHLLIFLAMGLFALFAAIGYTVGRHAYGYHGLGDLVCLCCFGWLAVCGGYYLYAHILAPAIILAGVGVGLPVVGVLNLNNMRDRKTDAATGKRTLVVRIGARAARFYHVVLLGGGIVALFAAAALVYLPRILGPLRLLVLLLAAVPMLLNLIAALRVRNTADYDSCMRPLAMATVLLSLVFALLAAL